MRAASVHPPDSIASWADRTLAALLLATSAVVPLVLTLASDDVFGLPKLILLCAVVASGLSLACVAAPLRRGLVGGPPSRWANLGLVTFVLLTCLATGRSADPLQSVLGEQLQYQGLVATLLYAGFLSLSRAALASYPRMRLLFAAVAAGATLVAAYALVQRSGLDPFWAYPNEGRPFGTLGHANALAAYLVLAVPATVSLLAVARTRARRIATGIAAAIIGSALLVTLSRGGYVGLLVAAAVVVVPLVRVLRRTPPLIVGGVLVGLALLGAVGAAVPAVRDMTFQVWRRALSVGDTAHPYIQLRFALLQVGAAIVRDHPWLGIGPEMFPLVFPRYRDAVLVPQQAALFAGFRAESPHNVYLAVAIGAGIPALLAYLVTIAGVLGPLAAGIRRAEEARQRALLWGLLAALSAHLATDCFMTAELTSSTLFWILMGVGLGLSRTTITAGGHPRPVAAGIPNRGMGTPTASAAELDR